MSIYQGLNMIAGAGGGGIANYDGKSITENASEEIQTVGVINSRDSSTAIKTWTGTRSQYDAIQSKDANTLYNITDDTDVSLTILEALYPVGSVYITTANTCPLSTLISGSTWTQEPCRQLVEKKEPTDSDPSWYNLYSDGWCEQGGIATTPTNGWIDVTFLKPFSNLNYYPSLNALQADGSYTNWFAGTSYETTTGMRVAGQNTGVSFTIGWQACGYTSTTTSHKRFRRTA